MRLTVIIYRAVEIEIVLYNKMLQITHGQRFGCKQFAISRLFVK
jgi:hypothetical protein